MLLFVKIYMLLYVGELNILPENLLKIQNVHNNLR